VNFASVTLESDKFVCIRHEDSRNQDKMISIVEVDTQNVSSHKINAESAIMNPKSKVVALRASNQLQIINLEMKSKMKDYVFKGESVLFWKWISVKTVAIVTEKSVYHWSMEGSSTPQKVFDRHDNLKDSTIINYKTDKNEQWLLLVGLAKIDGEPRGTMQLYSVERGVTQYIEGHAASFLEFPVQGGKTATVVAITSTNNTDGGKVTF
jgi:clathrin heavy chain